MIIQNILLLSALIFELSAFTFGKLHQPTPPHCHVHFHPYPSLCSHHLISNMKMVWNNTKYPFSSFNKPEVMAEVAALEIVRDHSLYYKVRLVTIIMMVLMTVMMTLVTMNMMLWRLAGIIHSTIKLGWSLSRQVECVVEGSRCRAVGALRARESQRKSERARERDRDREPER